MQKKDLIPTPLSTAQGGRRVIELAEPLRPRRFRFLSIALFMLAVLVRQIGARLLGRWAKDRYSPERNARYLRSFMERMGGLWVKAGQVVALRRDLFSEEFCAELSRLQDRARGFPGHYARKTLEAELGRPIEEDFEEFEDQPLAAASIGQVHRARLRKNGVEVVVKVRRPHIAEIIDGDLRIVRTYVKLLVWAGIAPQFRWEDMFWEVEQAVLEELDYAQEAASISRMRRNLRSHKVYVPKVFSDLCTDQVLVMERVHGVYMSEYIQVAATDPERAQAWLRENKIKPREAGERLLFSHYRQLFEENLYHCDLHPGNILLMRDSRITLIDFGSVGSLDRAQLDNLLHLFKALGSSDYYKAADLFLMSSPSLPDRDLTELKEQIVRFYREFESLCRSKSVSYHGKSVGKVIGQISQVLGAAGVALPWDMMRSNRAELTLDASLMFLIPDINYQATINKYLRQLRERQQKELRSSQMLRAQMVKLSESLDMPAQLAENAYFDGKYLRQRAIKYEGYLSKAARLGSSILRIVSHAWLGAALAAGVAYSYQHTGVLQRLRETWAQVLLQRLPLYGPAVWGGTILVALYISWEFVRMARILEQPQPARVGNSAR